MSVCQIYSFVFLEKKTLEARQDCPSMQLVAKQVLIVTNLDVYLETSK